MNEANIHCPLIAFCRKNEAARERGPRKSGVTSNEVLQQFKQSWHSWLGSSAVDGKTLVFLQSVEVSKTNVHAGAITAFDPITLLDKTGSLYISQYNYYFT
jgi:hypothetical protein